MVSIRAAARIGETKKNRIRHTHEARKVTGEGLPEALTSPEENDDDCLAPTPR
jgi:hypothetical protein